MQLLRSIKRNCYLNERCQQSQLVWVDGGYRGEDLLNYVKQLWNCTWQLVLRSDDQKGVVLLPRRWVVERTFAWILNARRLNKDYEKTRRNSQSMRYLAMIPLVLNRIK
jgi:putative transposase